MGRQGPTLKELLVYSDPATSFVGGVWQGIWAPFAVFGDNWTLNVLFFATIGLMIYNLIALGPKQ